MATFGSHPVTQRVDPMAPTDQITIRRAINGDEAALRAIRTQHAPRIDAVVRRLVGDSDLAADVAQEVWIQNFRGPPSYCGDSQFSTWTHRVAVNRTLNALRSLRRLSKVDVEIEERSSSVDHDGDRTRDGIRLSRRGDAGAGRVAADVPERGGVPRRAGYEPALHRPQHRGVSYAPERARRDDCGLAERALSRAADDVIPAV